MDRRRSDRIPKGPQCNGGRPRDDFLGPRGMRTQFAGEESWRCRCGRTIEAQPFFDQTCQIEAVLAAPIVQVRTDDVIGPVNCRGNLPSDAAGLENVFGLSLSMVACVSIGRILLLLAHRRHERPADAARLMPAAHAGSSLHGMKYRPLTPNRSSRANLVTI